MFYPLHDIRYLLYKLLSCVICHLFSAFCRLFSTTVVRALQIHPFLTNEPNFRKSQMNISNLITKNYEILDTWWNRKNEPKTNPIQTQLLLSQTAKFTQFLINELRTMNNELITNKPNFKGQNMLFLNVYE